MMRVLTSSDAIKRVVTCFILCHDERVAVLRRCATMPTFPSHWAGVSGSMEPNETPREAAQRELGEETNLSNLEVDKGGLYLDVRSDNAFGGRVIRVYPFTVRLPEGETLVLRGTEHDAFRFVTVKELLDLQPAVPGLSSAFHHATYGAHLSLPSAVRTWEEDRTSGAAALTLRAIGLAAKHPEHAANIAMLRPSMVPIVNAMTKFQLALDNAAPDEDGVDAVASRLLQSLELEAKRCVDASVDAIRSVPRRNPHRLAVATYSRSSTIRAILERVGAEENGVVVICGRSTPGDEGVLMAADLGASCVEDGELARIVKQKDVDVVAVGSDCVMLPSSPLIVNKIGTKTLAHAAQMSKTPVFCCADRWKLWDDLFAPPLEDIFEVVPADSFNEIIVPTEGSCPSKVS